MKNNPRMLGLVLCMLPMYLHAGTGQDAKQAYQSAQEQNTRSAEPIPAGTILPVSLNSTLGSDKIQSGATITATVMQDVPLGRGEMLRKGTKVTGHVVEAIAPGKGSDESKISFRFDQVRFGGRTVPITANLRALASFMEVDAAQVPTTGGDGISEAGWTLVKIGSDQIRIPPDVSTECGGGSDANNDGQAFWLFSPNACGTYGLGDIQISCSGRNAPAGEIALASNRKAVKLGKGSAMLLRVDGSGPEEAQAGAIVSRRAGQ